MKKIIFLGLLTVLSASCQHNGERPQKAVHPAEVTVFGDKDPISRVESVPAKDSPSDKTEAYSEKFRWIACDRFVRNEESFEDFKADRRPEDKDIAEAWDASYQLTMQIIRTSRDAFRRPQYIWGNVDKEKTREFGAQKDGWSIVFYERGIALQNGRRHYFFHRAALDTDLQPGDKVKAAKDAYGYFIPVIERDSMIIPMPYWVTN